MKKIPLKSKYFNISLIALLFITHTHQLSAKEINNDCVVKNKEDSGKEQASGRIQKITICTQDVFDENNDKENGLFYKIANFLHIKTKHKYIEEQFLFETGDIASQRVLDETERNIRKNGYIREASISTQANENNPDLVDVTVQTGDSWTTKPTFSYGHSGGASSSSIGLREDNLFGEGIRLSIKQKNGVDRNSTEFKYSDDTFLSSNKSIDLEYANTSDGHVKASHIYKPYQSLNGHTTYGIDFRNEIITNRYYVLGEESISFTHYTKNSDVYLGFSKGFSKGKTIRHQFGVQSETFNLSDIAVNEEYPAPIDVLHIVEKSINAPYYEYQLVEDRFKKVFNVRSIGRYEDRNYGYELRARFGIIEPFSNSRGQEVFHNFQLSKIFELPNNSDLSFTADLNYLVDSEHGDESRTMLDIEYFKNQTEYIKLFSSITFDQGHNLVNGQQVVLDNVVGLRGYPLNHLTGDTSVLFTIEERAYFKNDLWNIIDVGAAAFIDVGDVVGEENLDRIDTPYFRSVGVGLRLGSTRSSNGSILHIDFAKPLDALSGSRSYQFAIELKEKF